MSKNDALQVSCCGRHGIVGCERCFGPYRVVRPMVRRMSEEMVKSPTEKLDDIAASIARLGEVLADARAYKPCEPCLRDDHDNCTGDCSSMCCALAAAERERDSALADLAALRGRVEEARQRFLEIAVDHGHLIDWGLGAELDEGLAILAPPEGP